MSSFFTLPASQRKRKRPEAPTAPPRKRQSTSTAKPTKSKSKSQKPSQARDGDDESIASYSTSRSASPAPSGDSDASDAAETEADRRLKLAERYLSNIRAEVSAGREGEDVTGFDAEEIDRELIAARLKEDSAEEKGKLHRFIADNLDWGNATRSIAKANTLAMTGIALSADGKYMFACSKDMRIVKWEVQRVRSHENGVGQQQVNGSTREGKGKHRRLERRNPRQLLYTRGDKNKSKDTSYEHHTAPILCIVASQDGKFLATGGADRKLIIWDAATLVPLKIFTQHRDSVMGLAFRGKTNQLFSGSKDRTLKIWSLNELAYVETLFGHQDEVVDVAAVGGSQERCVSVGARDRTARLWKVVEESQLVFRGGGAGGGSFKRDRTTDKRVGHGASTTHQTANDSKKARLGPGEEMTDSAPPTFYEGSLDRVTQIDTALFITGSDSGALSLFSLHKKKPLHVYPLAHGWDSAPDDAASSAEVNIPPLVNGVHTKGEDNTGGHSNDVHPNANHQSARPNASNAPPTPRYITALASIPYNDVFVTGSWDGFVRVWRVANGSSPTSNSERHIAPVATLGAGRQGEGEGEGEGEGKGQGVGGVINDLAITPLGSRGQQGVIVAAAVGKEGRLGRWMGGAGPGGVRRDAMGKGKNCVVVWEVKFKDGRGV